LAENPLYWYSIFGVYVNMVCNEPGLVSYKAYMDTIDGAALHIL